MSHPFTLTELGSTYAESDERFVVSFILTYDPRHGVQTPEDAVARALDLTRDDACGDTHWYVFDRQTQTLHLVEQKDADNATTWP